MTIARIFLYVITAIAVVATLGVSIWSLIDTNRKYPSQRQKARVATRSALARKRGQP